MVNDASLHDACAIRSRSKEMGMILLSMISLICVLFNLEYYVNWNIMTSFRNSVVRFEEDEAPTGNLEVPKRRNGVDQEKEPDYNAIMSTNVDSTIAAKNKSTIPTSQSSNTYKTTTNQRNRNRDKPYFQNSTVVVLQIGTLDYEKRLSNHTQRNRQWADCMGYNYRFEEIRYYKQQGKGSSSSSCVYTQKVETIYKHLKQLQPSDWLIFVDMDAQYQAESCDAMEQILPRQSMNQSQPCEFIALTSPFTINTGIVLLKATNATIDLVKRWYETQLDIYTRYGSDVACFGPADQIALQEVIMKEYFVGDGPGYDGHCESAKRLSERGRCFNKQMPEKERSIRNLCLIGCHESIPNLQCKDCDEGNRRQCNHNVEKKLPIFLHEKYAPVPLLHPPR